MDPVSAVCILPTDDEFVYLIRQFRPVIDSYIYEVPAGGMESEDSDPIQTARRELAEEARFSAEEIIPRGYVYSSPGFCTEKLWLFEARNLTPCEDFARDADEIIDVVKIQKTDVLGMIKDGRISDAKTITTLVRCLL